MNLTQIIAERPTKTIYRDGDKMIKVFNEDYSKAEVLNEALNTARVEETGLNIPKLHAVTMVDGKWAIVNDYIEGTTLQELMEKNPEQLEAYLNRFVELQIDVLRHSSPMLNDLNAKLQKRISASGLEATTRYDLHCRLDAMHGHHKLCHGDFNPSNIIVTPDDKVYIIDWAHATQGNASADVARTYLLFWLEGKKDVAEMYMDLYCKKSDTAKQYVQKWLPIAAAAQLANPKCTADERALLMRWADVVEYV